MSLTILFFGSMLTLSMVLRPLLYKPVAEYFPAEMSSAFTSTWMFFSILISVPFLWGEVDVSRVAAHPWFVFLGVVKGVVIYALVKLQQVINKDSTSSSVFFLFMAFALGSLLNNIFFDERLLLSHLLAIMGFGVLGVTYFLKGDIKRLSKISKIYFIFCIFLATYTMVSDHLVIQKIGWYPYLLIYNIAMFALALIRGVSRRDFKYMVVNPQIALAGFVYAVTEFLIIYSSINVMPVSYTALFMRLGIPIVMIISAKKYGEQNILNQSIFGVIAFALAAVVIFF